MISILISFNSLYFDIRWFASPEYTQDTQISLESLKDTPFTTTPKFLELLNSV